ncbi:LTA synthase family protein [Paenimyroides ceti]
MKRFFSNRYRLLFFFSGLFLFLSFVLRIVFTFWVSNDVSTNLYVFSKTLLLGLLYDISVVSCFTLLFTFYLLILPNKWVGSLFDRIMVYVFYALHLLIIYFVFFAEVTFWDEFKSRFNFIAVDYLIYTYEVVKNIQESYPLPLLIGGIATITLLTIIATARFKVFRKTFESHPSFYQKVAIILLNIIIMVSSLYFLTNDSSNISDNRYNNEITKAGIFSFFAAFRNNHLKFEEHYQTIDLKEAITLIRTELTDSKTSYIENSKNPFRRTITDPYPEKFQQPNVVFVLMESMSASFMNRFGNEKNITPNLNALAEQGIFFTNMFANGTRTVRGMEAVTLSVPPTPGNSIVKRPDNQNLYTIGNVFRDKGYQTMFFYGGDGYFDNMNSFYGGNGFDIYDRGRGSILSDKIKSKRYNISDEEVTFENAWGICDEDIYAKVLKEADTKYQQKQPFMAFVMTTSNHKPYTYPANKIDIPSGSGREGAVKYADFAIGELIRNAKQKPWFKNTVFIFIADHCASSAGKSEIDVNNHHIPAIIYNLKNEPAREVSLEVAQIDIFPTLFSLMNWSYTSQFYGKDVFDVTYHPRSFVGTYINLGMKKNNEVVILYNQKRNGQYLWTQYDLQPTKVSPDFLNSAIANYQTADYLFSHGLFSEK